MAMIEGIKKAMHSVESGHGFQHQISSLIVPQEGKIMEKISKLEDVSLEIDQATSLLELFSDQVNDLTAEAQGINFGDAHAVAVFLGNIKHNATALETLGMVCLEKLGKAADGTNKVINDLATQERKRGVDNG